MSFLYVGLSAPKQYTVDLELDASVLDLSTVSAATLQIRKPDGTTTSWTTALSNQTPTTLTLTYTYPAAPGPYDQPGTWHFYAKLTIPGGFDRTEEWQEHVKMEHG